jgi:methylenetetrahydrofolate dehydrogenase (NADP+)/methenyltetrahydrofolate cyclohydrolase/formyltetrahydrofolate synthetase
MGLVEGMGKLGLNVTAAIRQPSGGPTMNIKGSAAGGGLAQCIPLTPFSLGLTGDINAIMNAHNLAMVALTSRMQHERNYTDEQLERLSGMKTLEHRSHQRGNGLDHGLLLPGPAHIIIGMDNGVKSNGFMMHSKFGIAV